MKKLTLFSLFVLLLSALGACSPAAAAESGIQLDILPNGSAVSLDGQPAGVTPLHIPAAAGEVRHIRVEHEGYYPLELDLLLPASGGLHIQQSLVFRPLVEEISTRATRLAWAASGELHFLREEDNGVYLYRLASGAAQQVTRIDDAAYRLEFAPDGSLFLSLNDNEQNGPGATLWENATPRWQRSGVYAFTWLADGSAALLYGAENGQSSLSLQQISPDGSSQAWQSDPGFADGDPEIISLSADGKWLSTQTSGVLQVWQRDGSRLQEVLRVEQASESRFSPSGEPRLAYLDVKDDLYLLDPRIPTSTLLVSGASFPLRWTPDGAGLLYPTYNAADGGSSLWRADAHNGILSLVADAALLQGTAADFGLSPDGKRLAYINTAGRLFLLTLKE